jgi:hypothetical protein
MSTACCRSSYVSLQPGTYPFRTYYPTLVEHQQQEATQRTIVWRCVFRLEFLQVLLISIVLGRSLVLC